MVCCSTPTFQAMVHVGSVRQTAAIMEMYDKDQIRTGDKARCRFRFVRHPEFIREDARIVFREGRTKAVGKVLKLIDREDEVNPGLIIGNKRTSAKQRAGAASAAAGAAARLTAADRAEAAYQIRVAEAAAARA